MAKEDSRSIYFTSDSLSKLDEARGLVSRSAAINNIILKLTKKEIKELL